MEENNGETTWLSAFERFHVPCLVLLSLAFICGKKNGVRRVTLHHATLTASNDESPYFHSSPLPHPVAVPEAYRLLDHP
ncbi:hypothetical protein T10_1073 [Trichinella papuae]|uniref:Uncharacterized protein n=1 Tax=Trichinella papuae TaxID=268474 RepID=A0A0V1MXU6_9BILA|nr:hypothetical protein T10_1073 [Trichinella papuae]